MKFRVIIWNNTIAFLPGEYVKRSTFFIIIYSSDAKNLWWKYCIRSWYIFAIVILAKQLIWESSRVSPAASESSHDIVANAGLSATIPRAPQSLPAISGWFIEDDVARARVSPQRLIRLAARTGADAATALGHRARFFPRSNDRIRTSHTMQGSFTFLFLHPATSRTILLCPNRFTCRGNRGGSGIDIARTSYSSKERNTRRSFGRCSWTQKHVRSYDLVSPSEIHLTVRNRYAPIPSARSARNRKSLWSIARVRSLRERILDGETSEASKHLANTPSGGNHFGWKVGTIHGLSSSWPPSRRCKHFAWSRREENEFNFIRYKHERRHGRCISHQLSRFLSLEIRFSSRCYRQDTIPFVNLRKF